MNNLQKKLVLNVLVQIARNELERHGDNVTADRVKVVVLRLFLTMVGDTDFTQFTTGWDRLQKQSFADGEVPGRDGDTSKVDTVLTHPLDISWLNMPWIPSEQNALNQLFNAVVPGFDPEVAHQQLLDSLKD
jgi:hypothetical protein